MELNKNKVAELKYSRDGLIPAIIKDITTGRVLMLAYMNELSLKKSIETGYTCFYSRSRQKLWFKGETSGNTQKVKQILIDCDNDTLLILVEQKGAACHTGKYSCFYRNIKGEEIPDSNNKKNYERANILEELSEIFEDRKKNPNPASYICHLMSSPGEKMLKKIVEEAAEVIISLKDEDKEQIIYEAADLWFHTLVALSYYGISYKDILAELEKRKNKNHREGKICR